MNPATPSPSDSSIAQAFRELDTCGQHTAEECAAYNRLFNRAREIEASPGILGCGAYGGIGFSHDATLSAPAAAVGGEEISPEFTDSARGAIAWVLWHHQEASSPIGQPLRFALGMGASEQLSDWRIAEAKRYAEWAKATTADFHKATTAAPVGGFVVDEMVNRFLCWPLPKDFAPDAGISFNPGPTQLMPLGWPVGTNLFTADQARAMFLHCASPAAQPSAKDGVRWDHDRALETSRRRAAVELVIADGWTWDGLAWVRPPVTTASGLVDAARAYMAAVDTMNDAMKDGGNVHGALSALIGTRDNLEAAIGREVGK